MAVVVCLAALCLGQDEKGTTKAPASNHEYLKPLEYFIGDWELTGEVDLAGKPALPFVYQRHLGWTLGKNFIETTIMETKGGTTEVRHKSIIGWEAKAKRITEWGFWNSNLPTEAPAWAETVTWSKDGETWLIERENVRGVLTIIDRDTHKYECQFRGDDGSENSWHFTAKRKDTAKAAEATRTALPDNIAKELGFFVGEWTAEGNLAGTPLKGSWSARWAPQKHCILLSALFTLDGEEVHGTGITGWDNSKEEVVTRTFFSNGAMEDIRYKLASPGVLKGIHTVSTRGEPFKANCEVRTEQFDKWTFKSTVSALSGTKEADTTIHLARLEAEPKKERGK
jgi:hypothetical protein